MRKLSSGLTIAWAETLAARVLGSMAQDPDLFGRFLGESGIALTDIRSAAGEPGFLAGVLDFLMRDEAALLAFAENEAVPAGQIAKAHRLLLGSSEDPA